MVHLADQRDGRAEYDRADRYGQIAEVAAPGPIEPRGDPICPSDTEEQESKAQWTRNRRPVRGDESQEGGGDQQAPDDPDDGRDRDALWQRAQRAANGIAR